MKKKPKTRTTTTSQPAQTSKPAMKPSMAGKKPIRPTVAPATNRDAATSRPTTSKLPARINVKPLPVKTQAGKPVIKPQPTSKPVATPVAGKPLKPLLAKPAVNGTHTNGVAKSAAKPGTPARPAAKVEASRASSQGRVEPIIPADKDLSTRGKAGSARDRIVMMVPDPFWLHVYWELSLQSIHRAEAALGQDWHGARPIIRLFDVTSTDTTSTSEAPLRDIIVHGGCNHWYIDVPQPPRSYRADIGYVSKRGQFYVLARSNVVTPPKAGATEVLDEGWAADIDSPAAADRILAMSSGFDHTGGSNSQLKDLLDEQFKRPMKEGQFGTGASPGKLKKFGFDLNAELIVYGQTDPNATVTLQNEPVKLRPDGTFTMRFSLPDSRQIIPAVATSADGMEEQTIVLAVERNIKRLDPMTHDLYSEQ